MNDKADNRSMLVFQIWQSPVLMPGRSQGSPGPDDCIPCILRLGGELRWSLHSFRTHIFIDWEDVSGTHER